MDNQYIFLAPEAIFPITKNENGKALAQQPATGFSIPGTFQGEGKMAGIPVLFLRTAGCNLRCMWSLPNGEVSLCDTPLASFDTRGEKRVSIDSVKNVLINNLGHLNHLIISGGEPFIQPEALVNVIEAVKRERPLHIAVETNGSIFHQELVDSVDFFSISPKLRNSVPTLEKVNKTKVVLPFEPIQAEQTRRNITAIQQIIDHCKANTDKDFQLKFVVQNHSELKEIEEDFLAQLNNWKPDDIVLMPLGSTPEQLEQTRMVTLEAAIERGWRYSPRLQITYFNGKPGV